MPFDLRLLVISLATFVAAGAAAASVVPWLARRSAPASPHAHASALFRLRLLPISVALLATMQGAASFVMFEPRGQDETFGRVLVGLALAAAGLLALGTTRLAVSALATRRALRRWMATAEPFLLTGVKTPAYAIDSPFPVVAVVGVIRPRLIIARSVLLNCSAGELRAIISHEQRHIVQRDNLRRAVLVWLPDVLSLVPAGRKLIAMWHDAAEAVADDGATELGATGRVDLASALLRVARLAPADSPIVSLPASALYRGEDIGDRVRRLLAPPSPPVDTRLSGWRRTAMSGGLIVGGAMALHAMHEIVEAAVSFLP
jgi:Zn-dependent protease with chaperone function